jgi:hypothetical protein
MTIKSLQSTSLTNNIFYRSMLAGNDAFAPDAENFLEEVVLTTSAASVTFSGLDAYSDYKHLQVRMIAQTTRSSAGDNLYVFLNGDTTGANYTGHELEGNGSAAEGHTDNGLALGGRVQILGSTTADAFAPVILDILDFSSASKNTTARIFAGSYYVTLASGAWLNTAAVTAITLDKFGPSWSTGSRFSLYGSKG